MIRAQIVFLIQMDRWAAAIQLFRQQGGMLRTKEALALGVHPRTLYQLRDEGVLEQVSRGVYRLAELPPLSHPDLVTVAVRVPRAVVCLVSAASYHDITTEIPKRVQIALPPRTKRPRIDHPPIRTFWFSGRSFTEGVEEVELDGVTVRLYGPEKTVADCFRFRNKIGTDVAVEALKLCIRRHRSSPRRLLEFARICGVQSVMRPYLEALQ